MKGHRASNLAAARSRSTRFHGRKKVLIVNCYVDETRQPIARKNKVPQTIGPVQLAGWFSPEFCEIVLYNELHSGPLQDEHMLGWPDMVVLTGLTTSVDRMLHITAYARTRNPRVIVVAGGHVVRALPRFCARYFDYCCQGDVEEIRDVVDECWGRAYTTEQMTPRYDLAPWIGFLGYVEGSRNCNFRCSFCTLTGEGRGYQSYTADEIRTQILALGKRKLLTFVDNNFYGSDRQGFLARLDVAREMREAGYFRGWAALVTEDFFFQPRNVQRAKEAGCDALFSGVESFDLEWLRKMKKSQNVRAPQVQQMRDCLEAGIVFLYGMLLDVTSRRIKDLRNELEFILSTPAIALPAYLSIPIPIPGTPLFHEFVKADRILPLTKVRDLDSTTISVRPMDSLEQTVAFVRDLQSLRGYRTKALQHSAAFALRYRRSLSQRQILIAWANAALLCTPLLMTSASQRSGGRRERTFVSTTEPLDEFYQPAFRVDSRYAGHFEPTLVTDARGGLAEAVAEDLFRPAIHIGRNEFNMPEPL